MTIRRGNSIIAGNSADIPSQTGQSGKFLTTNGTTTSWATVNVDTSDIYNKLDTKQDKSTAVNYDNVSNCITEIPQDIKLELNKGRLTLKAGSKVYVPNGFESDGTTPKFDEVVIENDKVCGGYNAGVCVVIIDDSVGGLYANFDINLSTYSGSSAPTDFVGLFYNTTTNTIGARFDTSSQFTGRYSLPIAIVINPSSVFCFSIIQVFNGFGYIGSTVFALPGVKGLIPNGRNADGSLRSIEFTSDTVKINTITHSKTLSFNVYISSSNFNTLEKTEYDEDKNVNYKDVCCCGSFIVDNNMKVISFAPKTPFHALDYNDKSTISGWGMPSNRYIDLTLGANGSTYTAPANGWFYIEKGNTAAAQFIEVYNRTAKFRFQVQASIASSYNSVIIPAKRGDVIEVNYNSAGTLEGFRFIYAEGELKCL